MYLNVIKIIDILTTTVVATIKPGHEVHNLLQVYTIYFRCTISTHMGCELPMLKFCATDAHLLVVRHTTRSLEKGGDPVKYFYRQLLMWVERGVVNVDCRAINVVDWRSSAYSCNTRPCCSKIY